MDIIDFKVLVKQNWHKLTGLFLALTLINIGFMGLIKFDVKNINWMFTTTIFLLNILVIIIWNYSRGYKKTPRKMIGILFAINEQDDKRYEELKYNFIQPIEKYLNPELFFVQVLSHSLCKLVTDQKSATKFMELTNSIMVIFGRCIEGKRNNEDKFEINLNSIIRHVPLVPDVQNEFQHQMSSLIPRVSLDKKDILSQYELTSEWLTTYASYFVGISLYMSGDLISARKILEQLREELKLIKFRAKPVLVMKECINHQLHQIYSEKVSYIYHNMYRVNKELKHLEESFMYASLANEIIEDPDCFSPTAAIYYFIKYRDIKKARYYINKMSRKNAGKFYSLAFLNAYEGYIEKAMVDYKKAFNSQQNESMSIEIEEFIYYVLSIEPNKYHLHLCLALINEYKGDYELANRDFKNYQLLSKQNDDFHESFKELKLVLQGRLESAMTLT